MISHNERYLDTLLSKQPISSPGLVSNFNIVRDSDTAFDKSIHVFEYV